MRQDDARHGGVAPGREALEEDDAPADVEEDEGEGERGGRGEEQDRVAPEPHRPRSPAVTDDVHDPERARHDAEPEPANWTASRNQTKHGRDDSIALLNIT